MADNMVTLVGLLGTEPELRTTPNGADVVNFSVATKERTRNADGKWVDGATSWFRISVWGTLARNAHASLRKGQRVVVHGQLRITEYATATSGTAKSADVRAFALGHDLAFGTSAFSRNAQPTAAALPPAAAPAPEQEDRTEDRTGDRTDEARVPEPVGGGWSAPLTDPDETPF
jgi:single-strand DNA-binding protein